MLLLLKDSTCVLFEILLTFCFTNCAFNCVMCDAGRHMDAEDMEDEGLQDMGDEAELLEEEFLHQRERRKAKKPK